MREQVYDGSRSNRIPITTAIDRVARLERLHGDLVLRYGSQHQLARRVAQQLGNAKAAAHIGEGAGL